MLRIIVGAGSALTLLAAVPAFAQPSAAAPAAQPAATPVSPPPRAVPDCRAQSADDIIVCGRRGDRSPYRLPPQPEGFDPEGSVLSVARERHKLYEVGDTGIGSCGNVGPGAWTGCQLRTWKEARQQRPGSGVFSVHVGKDKPPQR